MKKIIVSVLILLFFVFTLSGELNNDEIPGLTKYVMNNGLEVFIFESHVVPLAKVQISFRCGSITQDASTAGLFHFYEHMLFKGNNIYKSDSDFQSAMKELGVSSWNGGTSSEYVTYYFTVPSDKIEKGIEFWASAVRYPLFNENELEIEREVVINEIRGYINEPGDVLRAAVNKKLYYKFPWRRDVTGDEKIIQNASKEQMLDILNTYYIPNNAALFIGGDVDPEDIERIVNKYLGEWEKRDDPWEQPKEPHPFMENDSLLVYSNEIMYGNMMVVDVKFRGPDVLDDTSATYAADVWLMLLNDPNGKFKNNIYNTVPGIFKKEYIQASYVTQRDGAYIFFSAYLNVLPGRNTSERVLDFRDSIKDEMRQIKEQDDYFSPEDFNIVKTKLEDEAIINMETPSQFISNLSFWWASANSEYSFNYVDNLKQVNYEDISNYIEKYILTKKSVLSVFMNPNNYEDEKNNFESSGFEVVTKENAFWWAK